MIIFDPAKKEQINTDLRKNISQAIQIVVLDNLFRAEPWTIKDIVFHGGTSIHVAWHSPRWSEDLDFMISHERSKEINNIMMQTFESIKNKIQTFYEGSELKLKSKGNTEEVGSVLSFEVIWSHPKKHGNVRVKAEFYSVNPKELLNYHSINLKWQPNDLFIHTIPETPMLIEQFENNTNNENSEKIDWHNFNDKPALSNIAVPRSIYGDKITAIAFRPYTKARDFFDLWWLKTQPLNAIPENEKDIYDTIMRSAKCYNYSEDLIEKNIENFLNKNEDEIISEIKKGLEIFLPSEIYDRLLNKNIFEVIYFSAKDEMEKALDAIIYSQENKSSLHN